jgi:simple sugar transport system permease protein
MNDQIVRASLRCTQEPRGPQCLGALCCRSRRRHATIVNAKSYPLVDTTSSVAYGLLAGKIGTIPIQFFWLIALAVVAWVLLNRHRLGQNAYVVCDNPQAAQLMGIPIKRTRITLFVLVGMASALAALMNAFSLTNFYPNLGSGYLLQGLAAVFVGGTSVFGGRGTIYGTFLGHS